MGAEADASMRRLGPLGVIPAGFRPVTSIALRPVPRGLTLDRVARSHGWVGLPPFGYDGDNQHLFATLATPTGAAVTVRVEHTWSASTDRPVADAEAVELRSALRWCLGLDDDVRGAPPVVRATRMLRSTSVWEDLVKTLMTTNCSWSATVGMVTRIVEKLGSAGCFPSPDVVLDCGADGLRDSVRMGYRAASLARLAELVASGAVAPEAWREPSLTDADIVERVVALPGFGPYSAEGMLGLLGRPRGHAVDSWIRARLGGLSAAEITRRYAPHGRWAGAVLWQDVTAPWFSRHQVQGQEPAGG